MTVEQLIEKLSLEDQNQEVIMYTDHGQSPEVVCSVTEMLKDGQDVLAEEHVDDPEGLERVVVLM